MPDEPVSILPIESQDRNTVNDIVRLFWGDDTIAVHGELFNPVDLPGFKAVEETKITGILHYQIQDKDCEILTLASLREGRGIGSALLSAVEKHALKEQCRLLHLTTTNDNLHALFFPAPWFSTGSSVPRANSCVKKTEALYPPYRYAQYPSTS